MADESPITPEIRSLIGKSTKPITTFDEVCKSEIRRFVQAVMDDNPLYWDEEYAKKTKFGGIVGPGTFHYRMFRRHPEWPDRLVTEGPDWDGEETFLGRVKVTWPEGWAGFHGGNEVEVYQLAQPGDKITASTKLTDIYEKASKSGVLVFEVHETSFTNQKGDLLSIDRFTRVTRKMAPKGGKE